MPRSILLVPIVLLTSLAFSAPARAQAEGPHVPLEIFAGRLDFHSDLGLDRTDLLGARLGLGITRYATLQGFYWRALNDDLDGTAPLQAYGGEARLDLNAGRGVTPFLVAGLGRLDFLEGYQGPGGVRPDDRLFGIAGGGLRFDVWRVGLQVAARTYLMETDSVAGGDGSDDLRSNLLLSAGVAFRLGGGRRAAERADVPPPPPPVRAPAPGRIVERGDTVYVVRTDTVREEAAAPAEEERTVTIPVPREGELYVRYGPADGPSLLRRGAAGDTAAGARLPDDRTAEAITARVLAELQPRLRELLERDRAALREVVRDELRSMLSPGLTPLAERRLLDELEARVARRLRDEGWVPAPPASPAQPVEAPRAAPAADTARAPAARRQPPRFRPRELRPYLAWGVDRPRQFVAGLKLDLGPFDPRRPAFRLVPEAALGVGGGTGSVLIAANAEYQLRPLRLGFEFSPYAYAGVGFLVMSDAPRGRAGQEAVLNLGYGFTARLPHEGARQRFFVEHQGVDLFDLNRVIVGLRL